MSSSPRARSRIAVASVATVTMIAGALAFGTAARSHPADTERAELEQRLQTLVDAGFPAAQGAITHPDGSVTEVIVGDGDLPADGQFRGGSNTKMFVATVVLQLVDEGVISLDEPVETYLPGLIRGEGIDGAAITVAQLLQHTAGLPEYVAPYVDGIFQVRNDYASPRDLLDNALAVPASFAPGTGWGYSNTHYLVLGLLIERVTQRPLWQQIEERIAGPLGLTDTYLPNAGEKELRGDHMTHVHVDENGRLRDITEIDPSWAWAAGALVTTPADINTFLQALIGGELMSKESLARMQTTVPAPQDFLADSSYGLGLQGYTVDGERVWGHHGSIPGAYNWNGIEPDGTAVTIVVDAMPWAVADQTDEDEVMEKYELVTDVLSDTLDDE